MKKSNFLSYTVYIHREIQQDIAVNVFIGNKIARKLQDKHQVIASEVIECIHNNAGKYLQDDREQHKTNPPTLWFIAQTDIGRRLKVVFIRYSTNEYVLKTAYAPNLDEEIIYKYYGHRDKKDERKRY